MKTLMTLLATMAALATAQAQFDFQAITTPGADGGGARTGSGAFTLTLAGTTLTIHGSFTGLSSNSTAAHIHGPAGLLPATASVLYDFTPNALNLAVLGAPSGTIDGSFEMVVKQNGAYSVDQQLADLRAGLWYVNVHSATFGGGEIRGQLLAVPEPSTLALAGLAVSGLVAWGLRRRG